MFASFINVNINKYSNYKTFIISKLPESQICFHKKGHRRSFFKKDFDSKLVSGIVLLRESFSFVLVLIADNSFNGKRRKNPSHFNGIRLARCSTSFFIFCLLAHESGDLSQAETKLTLAKKAEQQNDNFFPSK